MKNDPIGQAILDFSKTRKSKDIIVQSDICEDDAIPSSLFFRAYNEMPELEKIALQNCKGTILDVGCAAGTHLKYLQQKGFHVKGIDISEGAVSYCKNTNLDVKKENFFNLKHDDTFDTILMLMNGIGISGTLSNLKKSLQHTYDLLNNDGILLFDSSDIKYLFEDDEGGFWIDLTNEYYGNFQFKMRYKDHETEWFPWLYVDFDTMKEIAEKTGFSVKLLYEKDHQYLAKLIKK